MSNKFNRSNLRSWWNSLDKLWQKILLLNLGVELQLGGIKSQHNWKHLEFWIFEDLYDRGDLGDGISIAKEISDDLLNHIVNLEILIVENAGITDLVPLARLEKLIFLNCSNNKIKDITPLKNLINLQELNLSWNNITSVIPLKNLNKLQKLELFMNNILSLEPIEDLENLEDLSCLFNFDSISELFLQLSRKWKKLKRLSAHNISNLINLPEFCPDLESLYVQGLDGDISVIVKLKRLRILYIDSNQINKLDPLTELTDLKSLSCCRNQIESIEPLRNLNKLEYLNFEINKVVDLNSLKGLKKLKSLLFRNNNVINLEPLKDLPNLEHLDCSNDLLYSKVVCSNKIKSLSPLNKLSNLKLLNCKNNPIRPGELAIFKALHPNCEIIF